MRILVTGGTGMVGKYLQEILPEAKYIGSKDCDLLDSRQVDDLWGEYKPTNVIHLGAKVGGIVENLQSLKDFIDTNPFNLTEKHIVLTEDGKRFKHKIIEIMKENE